MLCMVATIDMMMLSVVGEFVSRVPPVTQNFMLIFLFMSVYIFINCFLIQV